MLIPSAAERLSTSKFIPATAESPYHRHYFYIGGQYKADENGNGEHVFTDQMWVERLTPIGGAKHACPLVFIQGAGQLGTVSSSRFLLFKNVQFDHLEKAGKHALTWDHLPSP